MAKLKEWKKVLDDLELHLSNLNNRVSMLSLNDYKDIEIAVELADGLNSARRDLERVRNEMQEALNRWK